MDSIVVEGGIPLNGEICISGAKNAALPILAATLLTDETVELSNVPNLSDIDTLVELLRSLGAEVEHDKNNSKIYVCAKNINNFKAHYDLVKKMRASILVLGPLTSRFKKASVSMPGGCAIGVRPVDFHVTGLKLLGAKIDMLDGYINTSVDKSLKGTEITFPKISVTGTENILMAAVLAEGTTKIFNAASEPEIVNLAEMLISMGANISGHGTNEITVFGVNKLHGTKHTIISDRIELGTYVLTVAMTNGNAKIYGNNIYNLIKNVLGVLHQCGIKIEKQDNNTICVSRNQDGLEGVIVNTAPYPGFPTDLQAQLMSAMCIANSDSYIKETIWENRFMHVPELCRMGANITLIDNTAHIIPVPQLSAAPVTATDLRASFSLVMAGLVANGKTTISRIYHLDRGYDKAVEKLSQCGARIKRIS